MATLSSPTTTVPFAHPDRKHSNFRPLKAWRHFRNLVADKEDTEQVFHIIEALRGKSFYNRAKAYYATPRGKAALDANEYLPDILDDHETLKKLPEGTVGRAYVDFMEREGLTAAGLVAEYDRFRDKTVRYDDMMERYGNRQRDIHDMYHVLTGYGRDALGEQCVLAFTYSQNPNLGILFIAYAGGKVLTPHVPKGTPIYGAIRQAQKSGKAGEPISEQDIHALLAEPLVDARKRLGIPEPTEYLRVHEILKEAGIDPYALFGTGENGQYVPSAPTQPSAEPELAKAA